MNAPRRLPRPSFRDRLLAYVLVAALLPVATGVVAFGRWAAESERDQIDGHLHRVLQAGSGAFAEDVRNAEAAAEDLAERGAVQRALARDDAGALERSVEQESAQGRRVAFFSSDGALLAGEPPSQRSVDRSADVGTFAEPVGRVDVSLPLDESLLSRIAERIQLPADDALALVRDGAVVAGPGAGSERIAIGPNRTADVELDGNEYRARAAQILDGNGTVALVALRSGEAVDRAVAAVWKDAILGGVAMLAALGVVAFAVAPAVARSRLTVEERVNAARALAHVGDGIFLVDRHDRVRFWNPAAETITGLAAESVRDRPASQAIPGWGAVSRAVPVAAGGAGGAHVRPRVLPLTVGGHEVWLSISGVDFSDGTVYAFRDVTAERDVEELKSHFIATVSHELRTPLAAVYGAAMTLKRGGEIGESQRARLLSLIAEQTDRLAWIVDDVLLASQLAAGTLRMRNEAFDPVEAAKLVVEAARERLPERTRIELLAPDDLPQVSGDSDKARQVLANLVDNAVKYSPDGGLVEVRLEGRDGHVRFSVGDEGKGIPISERERIFEKFYRLDPDQTTGVGGTGLGLYICRELVRMMRGRIWVSSEPGHGSTFAFELPAVPAAAAAVTERLAAAP